MSPGATPSFVVTPRAGYTLRLGVGGTCSAGGWLGNTWTTGPVDGNCTVIFGFDSLWETPLVRRVSVSADGSEGENGSSDNAVISAAGRFVAFESSATNFVPDDTNAVDDVFVRDLQTGSVERVSVSSTGAQGNDDSRSPSISADGRFVAFQSDATNLVPDDSNGDFDIFLHDRLTGSTELISVASDGSQGDRSSYNPAVSWDGRYVAFESFAGNLSPVDGGYRDIFIRDRQTGLTELISRETDGSDAIGHSYDPTISADGRYVAFSSDANSLDSSNGGDANNGERDIFVRDRETGKTESVSLATNGGLSDGRSSSPAISADGRYIAFESRASNLVAGDTNANEDIFVRDRITGTTERVSVTSGGGQILEGSFFRPAISGSGRYVTFYSDSETLESSGAGIAHIFMHDRQTRLTTRVTTTLLGGLGNDDSWDSSVSNDGRYVAFESDASNLIENDTNTRRDVFVRDMEGSELMDSDGDGVADDSDNCPELSNAEQADSDADSVGDSCDNCPATFNPVQEDADSDGIGDACDALTVDDAFEPDDVAELATPLVDGETQRHTLSGSSDQDWVRFSLTDETHLVLRASGTDVEASENGLPSVLAMYLYPGGQTTLLDQAYSGETPLEVVLDYSDCTAPGLPSGDYRLMINGSLYGLSAGYDLAIEFFDCDAPGGVDTDNDGLPDATDPDDDNDGYADGIDPDPLDPGVIPASVLSTDFSSTDLSAWSVIDEGTVSAPSDWRVVNGELAQLSNLYSLPDEASNLERLGTYLRYDGGAGWSDYQVSYTQRAEDDDALGLMFRVRDADNYYRFSWDQQRGYRRLVKAVDGVFTELDADSVPFVPGQSYQITVVAAGAELQVWIDGALLFEVTDSSHATGTIALYSWGMQGGYFDDLQVHAGGTPPQPAPLLSADFSSTNLSAWAVLDEGTVSAPSDWRVVNGELAQLSNLYSLPDEPSNLARLGTYLRYQNGFGWSDYAVSYTQRAEDDDALGLMFRVRDANNYYRFSWDQQRGYRRLVKAVNGVFTELDADSVPFVPGQTYQVEVRAEGDQLAVSIDGTPLFQVSDSSHATGTIAFYSWGMQGGYLDDLQVDDLTASATNQPPQLSITAPAGDLSVANAQDSYLVTGTANDPDGSIVGVDCRVNAGSWLPASGTASWQCTLPLSVGANRIEVRADDDAGSTSALVSRTITRDGAAANQPPQLAITSPPGDLSVNEATTSAAFTGTASDSDGTVSAVSYQRDGSGWQPASGTSAWSFSVSNLACGATAIDVRAEDDDGAFSTTASRTVTRSCTSGGDPLLATEFSSADLSAWAVIDEGGVSAPSDWRTVNGELAQLSNLYGGDGDAAALPKPGTYLRYQNGFGWSDYQVSYTQRAEDDDAIGLMFRISDADNYYRLSADQQRGYRRLVKVVDGVFTELAADNVPYVPGQSDQITVIAQGEQLEVWIDGALIFQVSDSAHATGTIAFYSWGMQGGYFDDLQVDDLSGALVNVPPQISAISATPVEPARHRDQPAHGERQRPRRRPARPQLRLAGQPRRRLARRPVQPHPGVHPAGREHQQLLHLHCGCQRRRGAGQRQRYRHRRGRRHAATGRPARRGLQQRSLERLERHRRGQRQCARPTGAWSAVSWPSSPTSTACPMSRATSHAWAPTCAMSLATPGATTRSTTRSGPKTTTPSG